MSWFPAQIDRSICPQKIVSEGGNWSQTAKLGTLITVSILCGSVPIGQSAVVAQVLLQSARPSSSQASYRLLFVNSTIGADSSNGSEQAPLKTITQALRVVQPDTIIVLAPGTYSAETGETFPLQLKPKTTIKGEPSDRGQAVIIKGSGVFLSRSFARQNVTIVGANQAGLTGVTVTNPHNQGYGLWVESTSPVVSDNTFTANGHDGVSVVGSSAPIFRNNYFYQNGANGITIYGTSRPELTENIFEKTGFGINVAQNAAPRIVGNRITQNKDGIVVQGRAQPIFRNNVVDGNDRDGMVAIAGSRPNLGTSADPGNNTFLNNGQLDINTKASSETIPAFGNQIALDKTKGKLDFAGTATIADISVAPPISVASSIGFGQQLPRNQPQSLSIPVPPAVNPAPEVRRSPLFSRPIIGAARLPTPKAIVPSAALLPIQPALLNRSPPPTGVIDIPVPPPESGSIASTPIATTAIPAAPAIVSSNSPGLLPVPGGDAPIGNVGNTPTVPVWRSAMRNSEGEPPSLPSRATALGLRYRVVVETVSEGEQAQVKAIVPDAFTVSFRGRTLMQVGAFGDQAKANELLQTLAGQGLKASIEQ
ncbi:MAG: DUF1565 domain-containing protein [Phormidesmis sp. CAN_BIN36]|nr:DUF1565 domain-containing protein [Phormidesmis sp. CAN_BIN36]